MCSQSIRELEIGYCDAVFLPEERRAIVLPSGTFSCHDDKSSLVGQSLPATDPDDELGPLSLMDTSDAFFHLGDDPSDFNHVLPAEFTSYLAAITSSRRYPIKCDRV